MKYENKSFSVGMPRVTQEQWDAIFAKKRQERQATANLVGSHVCGMRGYNPMIDPPCPGCKAAPREDDK